MISLQEAQALVLRQARSFGKEKVALEDATGRIVCEKIMADRDYPPFNRATMDGIAINTSDWQKGIRDFHIKEIIFAGAIPTHKIESGECYKIMTGAAVPLVTDAVIRKEDLLYNKNQITVNVSEVRSFQNIALKGQDIMNNTTIIDQPVLCNAAVVNVLASLGRPEVQVEMLPAVSIITTGDEIVDIHETVSQVQIRNSNTYLLKSLLQRWKITPAISTHVKDDADLLLAEIKKCQSCDILVLSGAVSAGDADHVPDMLMQAGAKEIFYKVAIRPGKPLWFGRFENGTIVFALPGNPFSTLVTFKLFIEPFLQKCFGLAQPIPLMLPLSENRIKKTNLDEFFPVKITGDPSTATPMPFNTSGDITATLFAGALAHHPADRLQLDQNDTVSCITL